MNLLKIQIITNSQQMPPQSKTSPKSRSLQLILLPPVTDDFTAHHKKTTKRGSATVQSIAAQFIYNAICDNLGWLSGNSAEIVPLMKTNWRNQGSFLLPSQEAIPNNMKLPKPRSSFPQRRLKSVERTMKAKPKWGSKGEYP